MQPRIVTKKQIIFDENRKNQKSYAEIKEKNKILLRSLLEVTLELKKKEKGTAAVKTQFSKPCRAPPKKRKISELKEQNQALSERNAILESQLNSVVEEVAYLEKHIAEDQVKVIISEVKYLDLKDKYEFINSLQESLYKESNKYIKSYGLLDEHGSHVDRVNKVIRVLFSLQRKASERQKEINRLQAQALHFEKDYSVIKKERNIHRKARDQARDECEEWKKKWENLNGIVNHISGVCLEGVYKP